MGWEHAAREKQRAPIGEYQPEVYRVKVYDTFTQHQLATAALVIRNGMSVSDFLLFAADYAMSHHRKLKRFRKVFAKGQREILVAARAPVPANFSEPEAEQDRRRREALARFRQWAGRELREDITGERL